MSGILKVGVFFATMILYFFYLLLSTGKECPMFDPPQNGALACNKIGVEYVCAAMCQNDFDFTFNPPVLYYCSSGQWNFLESPAYRTAHNFHGLIAQVSLLPKDWPEVSGVFKNPLLLCLLLHKITRYPFILKVNILPMFSEMITATESISLQFLSSLFICRDSKSIHIEVN